MQWHSGVRSVPFQVALIQGDSVERLRLTEEWQKIDFLFQRTEGQILSTCAYHWLLRSKQSQSGWMNLSHTFLS